MAPVHPDTDTPEGPDLDALREVYETLVLLEPPLIARAARRFGEAQAAEARSWLDRQARADASGDAAASRQAAEALHDALCRASGAALQAQLAALARDAARPYSAWLDVADGGHRRRQGLTEHRTMVAACVAGDARAASTSMHDHLATTANRIAERLGGRPPFRLEAERCRHEPTSFVAGSEAFTPVRPGVDGATLETRDLTVTAYRYQPGAVWEEHAHPEDQLTLLLSGDALRFTVAGRELALRPGELILIPGDTPHSAVVGDAEVTTLNVWRLRAEPPA